MRMLDFTYLFRNKIAQLYAFFSLLSLVVCGLLLYFIESVPDFNPVFYIDMLSLFAVGSPLFVFGIYTFSWEFLYFNLFLKDTNQLYKFVLGRFYFYMIVSAIATFFLSALFYVSFGFDAVYPILSAFLFVVVFSNVVSIFITSYDIVIIDFFNDKFAINRQPSLHFLVLVVNVIIYSSVKFSLRFFEDYLLGLLVLFLFSLVFWFAGKQFALCRIINNLKSITYAYPR